MRRQGQSKQQSDINDIANALDKLAEKKRMPIFVGSSSMVLQTPKSRSNISQIQNIEETVDAVIKRRIDVSNKKHDRMIAKSETGNKKMDEILKRLESLERNARNSNQLQGNQSNNPPSTRPTLWNRYSGNTIPTIRNNKEANIETRSRLSNQNQNESRIDNEPSHPLLRPSDHPSSHYLGNRPTSIENTGLMSNAFQQNHPVTNQNATATHDTSSQPINVPTYADISRRNIPTVSANESQQTGGWRQRLHIPNGAGESHNSTGNSFAADVDVVAFNVNKNASAMDMRNWLSQKGVNVKKCELLTRNYDAPALSYLITVDPKDYERVTTDASVWPYQVGVRKYKQFTAPRQDQQRSEERATNEERHSSYGNQEHYRHTGYQRYDNERSGAGQQTTGGRRYVGNYRRY